VNTYTSNRAVVHEPLGLEVAPPGWCSAAPGLVVEAEESAAVDAAVVSGAAVGVRVSTGAEASVGGDVSVAVGAGVIRRHSALA
jgi:hypothetical protein